MCSIFKPKHTLKLAMLALIALLTFNIVGAQNPVTVSVSPPYTNKLSDYLAPGKIQAIFTLPSDASTDRSFIAEVYVHGEIYSRSLGIRIKTKETYRQSPLIKIQGVRNPASVYIIFPPYSLTNIDIQNIFSDRNLDYSGITSEQVQQSGLPAGDYSICFNVCQTMMNNAPVVLNTGCSSFTIQSVRPVVNQSVQVLPPYTKNLADYFKTSKLNSIITIAQYPLSEAKLWVYGYLQNESGSIKIGTLGDPTYLLTIRGSSAVTGAPPVFSPYMLTDRDFSQIFDMQALIYDGITKQQVQQQGLPEGNYKICFDVSSNDVDMQTITTCGSFSIEAVRPIINQTVQVMPPYTNRLTDYFKTTKLNSTITIAQYPQSDAQLKVYGYVQNENGSIKIGTSRDFPFMLSLSGSSAATGAPSFFSPYLLTDRDLSQIFNEQTLYYQGISKQQVQQQGLPEGNYNICFEVLSNDVDMEPITACSSRFSIEAVRPIINQTVRVMPQYTNKLTDYFKTSKLSSTITIAQYPISEARLSVYGYIQNASGSIRIGTGPESPFMLTLNGSSSAPGVPSFFSPYLLTDSDLSQIFKEQTLFYNGISKEQVRQQGLPEGNYSICFRVSANNADMEQITSCSNQFTIDAIQPIVNQVVQVMPPFSNRLTDYFNTAGKISSIITIAQYPTSEARLGLRGYIKNASGSIKIGTPANVKIEKTLQSTSSDAVIFTPYTLSANDLSQIFNAQLLSYQGITKEQVKQQGLPEGNYQICFELFDMVKGILLSTACSNQFTIDAVKPIVNQVVQVMPPFSNRLTDYFNTAGKISSIITIAQYPTPEARLGLRGYIKNESGSIKIGTPANVKIARTLQSTSSDAIIFTPYTLSANDLSQIFNTQSLSYQGITKEQVKQQGLPEGNYQICFELFDMVKGILLNTACSNQFTIDAVKPIVNQVVQVIPPFTYNLMDYFNTVGKINSIITITQYPTPEAKLGLRGYLKNSSGSIKIGTPANVKIAANLQSTTSEAIVFAPYVLSNNDLSQMFNVQSLSYQGTTRELVQKHGLPDDNYQICIEVFDMVKGNLLNTACSSPFAIQLPAIGALQVEPPIIINPVYDSKLSEDKLLALQFNWTIPSGAPVSTQYQLKIVELPDRNVNYTDMLRNNSYPSFFKTTVSGAPTYLYTIANPAFRKDKTYAFVVRAIDPADMTNFKNDGYSEVGIFSCLESVNPPVENKDESQAKLIFLSPRDLLSNKPDTVNVNNTNDLLINWTWGMVDAQTKVYSSADNKEQNKKNNIARYILSINDSKTDKALITRVFERDADYKIAQHFQLSIVEAIKAGFVNGEKYRAAIEMITDKGVKYNTYTSNSFIFNTIANDDLKKNVRIIASIKYIFDVFPELYPASNTEVMVDALADDNSLKTNVAARKASNPEQAAVENLDQLLVGPTVTIGAKTYRKISTSTLKTDAQGTVNEDVLIPQGYFLTDTLVFKLSLPSRYYVDNAFPLVRMPVMVKENKEVLKNEKTAETETITTQTELFSANFGQLVANTYAYRLKLNVQKKYIVYQKSYGGGMVNNMPMPQVTITGIGDPLTIPNVTVVVNDSTPVKDQQMVLFRVNKGANIPAYEGDIKLETHNLTSTDVDGITIVSIGKTTLDVTGKKSEVIFERLLSTDFNGEEYHIIAVKNVAEWIKQKAGKGNTVFVSQGALSAITGKSNTLAVEKKNGLFNALDLPEVAGAAATEGSLLDADNNFTAEEMLFKLALPKKKPNLLAGKSDYYRTATASYSLISTKPPTSIIKGRLMYAWPSEPNKLRPLANTQFSVMVDYVDEQNISIGTMGVSSVNTKQWNTLMGNSAGEIAFKPSDPNANPKALVDHYVGMATGKTDANGNFEIETVNLDSQGSLGGGTVSASKNTGGGSSITGNTQESDLAGKTQDELNKMMNDGYWSPVVNPTLNAMGNSMNAQSGMNSATGGTQFNSSTHFFEMGSGLQQTIESGTKGNTGGMLFDNQMNMHGPNPAGSEQYLQTNQNPHVFNTENNAQNINDLKRVFRIVIDGNQKDYYYPSKDVIIIQPFEVNQTHQNFTVYVREYSLKVKYNEGKEPLTQKGLQSTIFRDIADKPEGLPQGEGDGLYKYDKLIDPGYNPTHVGVFATTKFEHLWFNIDFDKSTKPLNKLIKDVHYSIQSSSYLSQEVKVAYNSTIRDLTASPTDNKSDWVKPRVPEYTQTMTLSPMPSHIVVELRDNSTNKPLKSGAVRLLNTDNTIATKPIDQYGKVEITAKESPLSGWLNNDNVTQIAIYGSAKGYSDSDPKDNKASLKLTGYQSFRTIGLTPAGSISGRILSEETTQRRGVQPTGTMTVVTPIQTQEHSPLPAWVSLDGETFVETNNDGSFNIKAPVSNDGTTKLHIKPKDIGYFDTICVVTKQQIKVDNTGNNNASLGNVYMKRMKHRIQIQVVDKNGQSIKSAVVKINDMEAKVKPNDGCAYFDFENVSVNNFTAIIKGGADENYIPQIVNISNPESKEYKKHKVVLLMGCEVSGVVKLDGQPVNNAKIYLDVSNTLAGAPGSINTVSSDTPNLIETRPYNSNGEFVLRGIPLHVKSSPITINIRASVDTTFTVEGDLQKVTIVNGKGNVALNMKRYNDATINKLYGFPMTVEKIEKVNANQVKVTGVVKWNKAISDFKLTEIKTVRVENVLFDLKTINGNKVGIAKPDNIDLTGIVDLKFQLFDKYNVQLSDGNTTNTPLKLQRKNGKGVIAGKAKIIDNSFEYPSSYLNFTEIVNGKQQLTNEFYLAQVPDNKVVTTIDAVTTVFDEQEAAKYTKTDEYINAIDTRLKETLSAERQKSSAVFNLSNQSGGALTFKLLNFKAEANPLQSYIAGDGKIHFNVDMSCHIPNAKPENFKVNIPDMVIDDKKVYPATGSKPLQVELEKWTLEVPDWEFSLKESGIASTKANIHTELLDIPVGKFVLRHDMFVMEDFKLNDMSLGGRKFKLQIADKITPKLNFEQKVGADMAPHWNLSLLSAGDEKVASIQPLKGLNNYQVEFNYIQILSDNKMTVQLRQQNTVATLMDNSMAKFKPLGLYNGADFIELTGTLNVGAPRVSDIGLTARWDNPTVEPKVENDAFDFETKGFVHFSGKKKSVKITKEYMAFSNGSIAEKPKSTFAPIPSHFFCFNTTAGNEIKYLVRTKRSHIIELNDAYQLQLTNGGMYVEGNDWGITRFEGWMSPKSKEDKSNLNPSFTKFKVMGDVLTEGDANVNGNGVKSTDINGEESIVDTPTPVTVPAETADITNDINGVKSEANDLKNGKSQNQSNGKSAGQMTQTFEDGNLIGSINIPPETCLGGMTIHKGALETSIGKSGFYFAGNCYAYIPAGIFSGDYNVGFMGGYYPLTDKLWEFTNTCIDTRVRNECYKGKTLQLSGFYMAFNKELFKIKYDFNFIVVSGGIDAIGLIGGDCYFNISNIAKIGLNGYVYVDANAKVDATIASIEGGVTARAGLGFQLAYPLSNSYIQADIGLGFKAKACVHLGFVDECASESIGCQLSGGTKGFKFSLDGGGGEIQCGGAIPKN